MTGARPSSTSSTVVSAAVGLFSVNCSKATALQIWPERDIKRRAINSTRRMFSVCALRFSVVRRTN